MSNSYNPSTILADPSSVVAGRDVEYETIQRIANANNYSFAVGACHNVLSQSYSDITFIQDSGSLTEMSQWRIPLTSLQHSALEIVVNYKIHGVAVGLTSNIRFTLDVDGGSATVTINLPNSSNGIANDELTISMPSPSATQVYYGTLTAEVQADAANNSEVEIRSIMARWKPLSSPLSTGFLYQYDDVTPYTPKGTTRTGHNQALTSRFGHQVIDNIELLRTRLKTYLTWSSVYNVSSSIFTNPLDGAAPEAYLSVGHIDNLLSQVLISEGWDNMTNRKLELHIRYITAATDKSIDFLNNSIDLVTGAGGAVRWDEYTLELDYGALSEIGDTNLNYYTAKLNNTNNNISNLGNFGNVPSVLYPTINSSNHGFIISASLMGV